MVWTNEEIKYLKENYPSRTSLEEISQKLNKSIGAIQKKAIRLSISRPKKELDPIKRKIRLKRANDNYYKNHSKEIYLRKKKKLRDKKIRLVKLMGNKCQKCGYSKCIQALEFHHTTGNKEENITKLIKDFSEQKALKELKKCILVCANCHRELHSGIRSSMD